MSQPMYASRRAMIMRQLQRDYGKRYVQRLVDHMVREKSSMQTHQYDTPIIEGVSAPLSCA